MNPELPDIILIFIGRKRLYLYGARLEGDQWQFSPSEKPASEYDALTEQMLADGYLLHGKHEPRFKGQKLASPVIFFRGELEQALKASKVLHDTILKDVEKR